MGILQEISYDNLLSVIDIMIIIGIITFVVIGVFIYFTFSKYRERRNNVSFFLGMHYLSYLFATIFFVTGQSLTKVNQGMNAQIHFIQGIAFGGTTIGTMFLFLFFTELRATKPLITNLIKIFGILLAIWSIAPFDDDMPLSMITYTLMFLYNFSVYLPIAINFLKHVSTSLKIKNLRYTNGTKQRIKKVAVCGGSGSELIPNALKNQVDAYVTADVKYHGFQDAQGKLLLIDAGHYETEIFCIDEIQKRLRKFLVNNPKIKILKFRGSTNPVIFFNN